MSCHETFYMFDVFDEIRKNPLILCEQSNKDIENEVPKLSFDNFSRKLEEIDPGGCPVLLA